MASRSPFRAALARPAALAATIVALGAVLVAAPVTSASAAQTPATCASPVTLTNGSFEEPFIGYGTYAVLHQSQVPGWNSTAPDEAIEIWGTPFLGVTATNGTQIAELNANYIATLYQDVATTPGQVLRWSLDHRGRDGVDVMAVKLGAPSGTLVQQGAPLADGQAWATHTGLYTVPAGQTTTRFAFESISSVGGGGVGNLLDNISLGNASCVVTTKSVTNVTGGATAQVGDILEYTVVAENRGGTPANSAIITDALPSGLSLVPGSLVTTGALTDAAGDDAAEVSGTTITARVGTGATSAAGGSIPAGESRSLTFRARVVTAAAATTVRNEATTTYVDSLSGSAATSLSNETTTSVANAADLGVTQTLDTALQSGAPARYTITVVNNGPHAAVATILTSTLPPLQAVSTDNPACSVTAGVLDCAFGTLGIGSPVSVTLSGTVPANAVGGTAFVLESNVETATTDPVSANDTATRSDAVAVVATLGLAVTITDSTPGSTEPGDILQAAYSVTNTGNVTITGVSVTDPVFGAITCTPTTLAPGDVATCSADVPYTVTAADAIAGRVSTTATAAGTPPIGSGVVLVTMTAAASIVVTAAAPADAGELAVTGVEPTAPLLVAIALLLAGAALTVAARRTRRPVIG